MLIILMFQMENQCRIQMVAFLVVDLKQLRWIAVVGEVLRVIIAGDLFRLREGSCQSSWISSDKCITFGFPSTIFRKFPIGFAQSISHPVSLLLLLFAQRFGSETIPMSPSCDAKKWNRWSRAIHRMLRMGLMQKLQYFHQTSTNNLFSQVFST